MSKEFDKKAFDTSIGSKALVQREEVKNNEIYAKGNQILRSVGKDLFALEVTSPGVVYVGSAAMHIYIAERIGIIQTISQATTLGDCPELVAGKSLTEMRAAVMAYYGQRSGKLRSGHY